MVSSTTQRTDSSTEENSPGKKIKSNLNRLADFLTRARDRFVLGAVLPVPVESPEISGDVEEDAGQQTDSIPFVLESQG